MMHEPRDKIFITCAVTGNLTTPEQTPHLPITPEQIAEFRREHHEPLVPVPPQHEEAFKAGKIAVLLPPPEMTEGEDIVVEAIGIVDRDRDDEALYLLRLRIVDLPAIHKREVFYYNDDIWPPVEGEAFEPLIGPAAPLT